MEVCWTDPPSGQNGPSAGPELARGPCVGQPHTPWKALCSFPMVKKFSGTVAGFQIVSEVKYGADVLFCSEISPEHPALGEPVWEMPKASWTSAGCWKLTSQQRSAGSNTRPEGHFTVIGSSLSLCGLMVRAGYITTLCFSPAAAPH